MNNRNPSDKRQLVDCSQMRVGKSYTIERRHDLSVATMATSLRDPLGLLRISKSDIANLMMEYCFEIAPEQFEEYAKRRLRQSNDGAKYVP